MIPFIKNDSFDWSIVIELSEKVWRHDVVLVRIAEHKVLDQVQIVVLVVYTDVDFGFTEAVLARSIH